MRQYHQCIDINDFKSYVNSSMKKIKQKQLFDFFIKIWYNL